MPYAAATRVLPCMAAKASLRWKLATISEKKKEEKEEKNEEAVPQSTPSHWTSLLASYACCL